MDWRARRDMDSNEHLLEGESGVRIKCEELQPPTLLPENVAAPAQPASATNTQQQDSVKNSENGFEAKIKLEALPPILFPEKKNHVGMVSALQAFTTEKNPLVIWDGDLEWQDKTTKGPDLEDFAAPNKCRITILANTSHDKARLEADTWPLKLNLQLVHEKVLRNVRGTHLRQAPSGMCLIRPSNARDALRKALTLGRVGFVFFHLSSTDGGKKVLILQYSFKRKGLTVQLQSYTDAIVQRIEKAIQLHKEAKRTSMRKKQFTVAARLRVSTEIWKGTLQWVDANSALAECGSLKKAKCRVLAKLTDGKPEVNADSWPQKLVVQLVPKRLLRNVGGASLKDSKSVFFYSTTSATLEGLTKVMSTSLAGCIQLTSVPTLGDCDTRVLILLYSPEKKIHIGFIPNDQTQFIRRLKNESQQENSSPQDGSMTLELSGSMPFLTAATTEDVLRTRISISVDTAPEVEQHKSANVMAIEAVKSQDSTTEKKGKSFSTDIKIASKRGKENTVPGGTLGQQEDKVRATKRHLCYPMQRARELNLLQIESLSQGIVAARREIAIMEENLELARQQERRYEIQESEYAVINRTKTRCVETCQAS